MLTKLFWAIGLGLAAHILELGFGLRETRVNYVVMAIGLPILILVALGNSSSRLGGRLKGAKSTDFENSDSPSSRDGVFVTVSIVYVLVYLGVLLRARPRDWELSIDLLGSLSPIELYWLIAPIFFVWWYRELR